MKSNLKINSNVFLRKFDTSLGGDEDFLPHVRGVNAVRKLLWKVFEIYPTVDHNDSQIMHLRRKNRLTEAQFYALEEAIFCFQCNRIPVGRTFNGTVEFRCDRDDCRR
jgi:hypothetical protein